MSMTSSTARPLGVPVKDDPFADLDPLKSANSSQVLLRNGRSVSVMNSPTVPVAPPRTKKTSLHANHQQKWTTFD